MDQYYILNFCKITSEEETCDFSQQMRELRHFFFLIFFSFLFFLVALLEYLVHFHLTLTDVSWWLKVNLHPSLKQRWDYSIQACSVTCIRMCCFSVAGFALKPGLVWLSETFQKKVMAVDEARMTSFFVFFLSFLLSFARFLSPDISSLFWIFSSLPFKTHHWSSGSYKCKCVCRDSRFLITVWFSKHGCEYIFIYFLLYNVVILITSTCCIHVKTISCWHFWKLYEIEYMVRRNP